MTRRLQSQDGFGLIELLAAIVMINIGIIAILLTLNSAMSTLRRSAERSTAAAVADKQLERYRAITYNAIYLDTSSVSAADSTYTADSAYSATQVTQGCSPLVVTCMPTQTVTGPDNRTYRIDSYIVSTTPPGGDPIKKVTVVVRKPGNPATLARVVSTYGENF